MEYDYFQLTLGRERTAQKVLADHLYGSAGVQAVFAPLLGFASDQALVLAAAGGLLSTVGWLLVRPGRRTATKEQSPHV